MCVRSLQSAAKYRANAVQTLVLQQFAVSCCVAGEQRSLHCPAPPRLLLPGLAGQWDGFVSIELQLFSGKYLSIEIEEL